MPSVRYVVAVSGGVDSVVLLAVLAQRHPGQLVVAHVDHGIRYDSTNDAGFVKLLAARYGLSYRETTLQLGTNASEAQAREGRYAFLRMLAQEYAAPIATAHHADDVIETIAINLLRGTGWRGLAVMGAADIYRPLLRCYKADLYEYAVQHRLEWCEDYTNATDVYLRNRVRRATNQLLLSQKNALLAKWRQQGELVAAIDTELVHHVTYCRYVYITISLEVARELLRYVLLQHGISQTRPQLDAVLLAIKTARAGTVRSLNARAKMRFSHNMFSLET